MSNNYRNLYKNLERYKKARALEETSREEPKVISSEVVKRIIDATRGSGRKWKRGHFGRSD
ncbi:hypothetical protein J1N35_044670 [Gossypium stocksii]|uniref:Uncharacterized protein n=1 Tax=Gossypium stocksii TaxID=47602 RepID=A0A9D3ZGB6_9ROSI|nr:hypothetical protein J1N35_044670 [Gossypium stocksii]